MWGNIFKKIDIINNNFVKEIIKITFKNQLIVITYFFLSLVF